MTTQDVLKTPELQKLVNQWIADPCWDLEDTEGFEDYREPLLLFRLKMEAQWAEWRKEQEAKNPRTRTRTRALEVVAELKAARIGYAEAVKDLAWAERQVKLKTARAETNVIATAGDEKNLGSNQVARDRMLLIAIQTDVDYQAAYRGWIDAEDTKGRAWAEMEALRDELKVLLAFAGEGK